MTKVTRDVDLDSARDLLERVPRACLSFASDSGPQVQPVKVLWQAGRYLVRIPEDAGQQPVSGQEAVLLIDEGIYYFQLRAIYIRGRVQTAEAPIDGPSGQAWFEVIPTKVVAWDYGKLREVSDGSG